MKFQIALDDTSALFKHAGFELLISKALQWRPAKCLQRRKCSALKRVCTNARNFVCVRSSMRKVKQDGLKRASVETENVRL